MLDPKGSEASRVAGMWWLMFGLAAGVYVVVAGFILYASTRGRRTKGRESRLNGNLLIWIGGVIAPLMILLVLAVVTVDTTSDAAEPLTAMRCTSRSSASCGGGRCAIRTANS